MTERERLSDGHVDARILDLVATLPERWEYRCGPPLWRAIYRAGYAAATRESAQPVARDTIDLIVDACVAIESYLAPDLKDERCDPESVHGRLLSWIDLHAMDPQESAPEAQSTAEGICQKCKGSGELPGYVQGPSGDPQDATWQESTRDCDACNGTGEAQQPPASGQDAPITEATGDDAAIYRSIADNYRALTDEELRVLTAVTIRKPFTYERRAFAAGIAHAIDQDLRADNDRLRVALRAIANGQADDAEWYRMRARRALLHSSNMNSCI